MITKTVRNLKSARVSIPSQLVEVEENGNKIYKWKVDLMKSQVYWKDWFSNLTESFLSVKIPKLLLLAEKERMDTALTIAQMQGRFRLVILYDVGHIM